MTGAFTQSQSDSVELQVPEQLEIFSIKEFALSHPELTPIEVGVTITKRLKKSGLQNFAVRYVSDLVENMRRYEVRRLEERAERKPNLVPVPVQGSDEELFRDWFKDPQTFSGNVRQRKRFKTWCGDKFDEWFDRGLKAAEERGGKDPGYFQSQWLGDYWEPGFHDRLNEIVTNYAADIRLETTKELLSSVFALGDGTQVTWGSATVEQHQQRIKMLMKNVEGTMETAIRHEAAVKMIQAAGVKRLIEVAG